MSIRVFKPKSFDPNEEPNGVEIEELNVDSPENYLKFCKGEEIGKYYFRSESNGGSDADWKWLGIPNPYPDDEVKSQAAFMFYMNNTYNRHYRDSSTALIVCNGGDNFAYCIGEEKLEKLEKEPELSQSGRQK